MSTFAGAGSRWPSTGENRATAFSYLLRLIGGLERCMPGLRASVVGSDKPAPKTILKYGEKLDVDLIAVATSGRSSLARLLRGSIVDALIRKSKIPLLVCGPNFGKKGAQRKITQVDDAGSEQEATHGHRRNG